MRANLIPHFSLISPKIAILPRYGLPNAPAFHTIYPRAETRAQEIHAGDDDHDTRGTRRVPKADSASDAGDRVLLAQGGAARALDTALHRLRTALLLPAPALPRPGLHVRQGGVVPGVRARDAVQLHDQPPPRARLRGRRALRHRHHPAGRGPADDGQHRRNRKHARKPGFGHAAGGHVHGRDRRRGDPQLASPDAIAAAAWRICSRNDVPPTDVLSTQSGVTPR